MRGESMRWGAAVLAVLGCGLPGHNFVTTTSTGTSTTSGTTTTTAETSSSETTIASSASDSLATMTPFDSSFLIMPDVAAGENACDQWAQDCPPGYKCLPAYGDQGGWATHCFPVARDPKQPGEACSAPEGEIGGPDDCDVGSMCWDVDPDTLMGRCVSQCKGSEANPVCADPCISCNIFYESNFLLLCLPACDPVLQDCTPGRGCYPIDDWFVCLQDTAQDGGAAGEPCESIIACDVGNFCADAGTVPGCPDENCCAPFCALDEPDNCDALLPGTTCTPWFEYGMGIDTCLGGGLIGACLAP